MATTYVTSSATDGHVKTPDGWSRLTPANLSLGRRFLKIMVQMNRPTYATDRPWAVAHLISRPPCEYFHYRGDGFEVVCGFKLIRRSRRYRVMSVGFVGDIGPRGALDLVVERIRMFLLEKNVHHLITVRPAVMENPRIIELYEAALRHPGLIVRGRHQVEGGTYWWLRVPDVNSGVGVREGEFDATVQ